jgi:hypothetical protein
MRKGLLLLAMGGAWAASTELGVWQIDSSRSIFTGQVKPRKLTVRIEPHVKGEVFTLDRTEADGRSTSFSSILYFDGVPRELQDFACSGTQTSSRLGDGVVEILQSCRRGAAIRFLLRVSNPGTEMILDVTEQHPGGSRTERHIVLKKQTSGK